MESYERIEDALATARRCLKDPAYQRQIAVKNDLNWQREPRLTDPDLSYELRCQSATLLLHISSMKAEQESLAPTVDPQLESMLLQLCIEVDLVYWRTFRINDFPPEILTHIFRYVVCLPDMKNHDLAVNCRLWLTWVCRRWRSVVIADFTFWNAVWFTDQPPYTRSLVWFDRAGTAPLDIRIDTARDHNEEKYTPFPPSPMAQLLDQVFTKLSTIRRLVIVINTWANTRIVLEKLKEYGGPGRAVNMESLLLYRKANPYRVFDPRLDDVWPYEDIDLMALFGVASPPSLKYIGLNGVYIDWDKSRITNLTNLDLRGPVVQVRPRLNRFREILKLCPNLHKLVLVNAGPIFDGINRVDFDPIQLPRLMVLVLGGHTIDYATRLLSQFSAPNVRDLTLMNLGQENCSPLLETMTSRFREVRSLSFWLNNPPPSLRIVVNFLHSLPYLSRLSTTPHYVLTALLEDPRHHAAALSSREASYSSPQALCTKLKVLETHTFEMAGVLQFGRGRRTLGYPLQKIHVGGPPVPIPPEEQTELPIILNRREEVEVDLYSSYGYNVV
jgi:hypothetical protein